MTKEKESSDKNWGEEQKMHISKSMRYDLYDCLNQRGSSRAKKPKNCLDLLSLFERTKLPSYTPGKPARKTHPQKRERERDIIYTYIYTYIIYKLI